MKTAKEWFEMLNEPERSQAIVNCSMEKLKEKCGSLEEALDSLRWEETPQGFDHWHGISNQVTIGTYPFKESNDKSDPSQYWIDKIKPDIFRMAETLIQEGKKQGYKISVSFENS